MQRLSLLVVRAGKQVTDFEHNLPFAAAGAALTPMEIDPAYPEMAEVQRAGANTVNVVDLLAFAGSRCFKT